jgi:hypothetical protein
MGEVTSWIKIGPRGTFAASGTLSTTLADLDEILGSALSAKPRLLIHVHGGLVNETRGREIADSMMKHYGEATRSLSLVWETGVGETLRDNVANVANTKVFKKVLSWVLSKAIGEITSDAGAKGRADGMFEQSDIERSLQSEAGVAELDAALEAAASGAIAEALAKGGPAGEARTEEKIAEELSYDIDDLRIMVDNGDEGSEPIARATMDETGSKGATLAIARFVAKVIIAVVRRYRAGTHHDPLPTAVEELLRAAYLSEIGEFAWSEMKAKATEMWIDDGPTPDLKGHVGGYILRKLEELQRRHTNLVIDIVGHSAGSIVICAMLAEIKRQSRQIQLRHVLFLAPAVRLDTFREAVMPPRAFRQFRMFTMTDDAEKADRLVGAIYPRSLLFLVSALFEDKTGVPLAGLARHILRRTAGADASFDELRRWLATDERLVLSPSAEDAVEGLRSGAARHGDFDDDMLTLSSLLFLAKA